MALRRGSGDSENHRMWPPPSPARRRFSRCGWGGRGVESRVASALEEITSRYPSVELSIAGLSRDGVLVKTWWRLPEEPVGERHTAELRQTIEDSREATILLLQTIARTNPGIDHLGAFEDRAIVPIWSREQVLTAGDPRQLRVFARFSEFQFDAERQTGRSQHIYGVRLCR